MFLGIENPATFELPTVIENSTTFIDSDNNDDRELLLPSDVGIPLIILKLPSPRVDKGIHLQI